MSNYPKREMTKIKCTACGAEAEVPFVPTPGRDVFCKECYQSRRKTR